MVRAFIMVKAEAGHAEDVLEDVLAFGRVTEAHVVAGDFDLIVEAEGEEVYDVMHSAATAIRGLGDVTDTKTYVCLE
jgi:DNA-binding Lrp family transcriptional regulator